MSARTPSPGENTRNYYRLQGAALYKTALLEKLEEVKSARRKAANDSTNFSQTISFTELVDLLEGKKNDN